MQRRQHAQGDGGYMPRLPAWVWQQPPRPAHLDATRTGHWADWHATPWSDSTHLRSTSASPSVMRMAPEGVSSGTSLMRICTWGAQANMIGTRQLTAAKDATLLQRRHMHASTAARNSQCAIDCPTAQSAPAHGCPGARWPAACARPAPPCCAATMERHGEGRLGMALQLHAARKSTPAPAPARRPAGTVLRTSSKRPISASCSAPSTTAGLPAAQRRSRHCIKQHRARGGKLSGVAWGPASSQQPALPTAVSSPTTVL